MGYSSLAYQTQVGVEVTPGTGVTADKRLLNLDIVPAPSQGAALPETSGRFPTVGMAQAESTIAEMSGVADFDTLTLLFLAMFGDATPEDLGPGSGAYKWSWTPGQWTEASTLKTLTVEHGKAGTGNALKFTYGLLRDLGLDFDKNRAGPPTLSGTMIGKAMTKAETLSSASDWDGEALPNAATVYLDTTPGNIGTTVLGTVLSASLGLRNWWEAYFLLRQDETDFGVVERRNPEVSLELTLLTDSTGMGLLDAMRNAGSRYLQLSSVGTLIADTYYHQLDVKLAAAIAGAIQFRHDANKFVVRVPFSVKYDTTLTYGVAVELTNTLSTV